MKTLFPELAGIDDDLIHLVKICEDLLILKEDCEFQLSGIYVSPAGRLVFCVSSPFSHQSEQALLRFVEELRLWTIRDLDIIAEEYFYAKYGQAMLVLDAMCNEGLLTYRDANKLEDSVNSCFRDQTFLLMNAARAFITGEEYISSGDCI